MDRVNENEKWLLLLIILLVSSIGLAVGLTIHFKAPSPPQNTTTSISPNITSIETTTKITSVTIESSTVILETTSTTTSTTPTTTITISSTATPTTTKNITTTEISTTQTKTLATTAMTKITEPTQKAVLMLSTRSERNVPMVIGLNGESDLNIWFVILIHLLSLGDYDDDLNFTYDENTEVVGSCSASLNNRMLVFGGWNQWRQVYINHIILFYFPLDRIR